MILIILEIITLKRHQTDHRRLLRRRGHLVRLERLGDMRRRLCGRRALPGRGGISARGRLWSDSLDLRAGDGAGGAFDESNGGGDGDRVGGGAEEECEGREEEGD